MISQVTRGDQVAPIQNLQINKPVQSITWIDMKDFINGSREKKIETAIKFGKALAEIGFAAVSNVGMNQETIDKAFKVAEKYFALENDIKMQTRSPDGLHGFFPFGTEHAKYTQTIDLKEFYQTSGPTQPLELWPDFQEFKEAMMALYAELDLCVKYCLQATSIYLGYVDEQEESILSDMVGSGNAIMRILHYPPVDPVFSPPGAVRSAPHEDVSVMTVIPRATAPGLQVKNSVGEWIPVDVPEGAAIINAGDALQFITNKMIPSTTHQVVNPPESDLSNHRYSIPFFADFPSDTVMQVLDRCKGATPESQLPGKITYGEFLRQRLEEIGLK